MPSADNPTLSLDQNQIPGIPRMVPYEFSQSQKTPEMNELETDKTFLKIWAHNFKYSLTYIDLLPQKKRFFFGGFVGAGHGAFKAVSERFRQFLFN